MKQMIPANLDSKVKIREKESHCYHVKVKYVNVNPLDPAHPTTKEEVRAFRKQDYLKIFGGAIEQQIENKKTIGWDTAELVHDPSLLPSDPIVIEGPVKFEPSKIVAPLTDEEKIEAGVKAELEVKEVKIRRPRKVK